MNQEQRLNLKVEGLREAFRERVSRLTDDYENRIVDLRVDLTILSEQLSDAKNEIEELKRVQSQETTTDDPDVEDSNNPNSVS